MTAISADAAVTSSQPFAGSARSTRQPRTAVVIAAMTTNDQTMRCARISVGAAGTSNGQNAGTTPQST
ncbi:hypothetical protein GCM10022243_04220 [Saccharothrix violaceirubra]